MTFTKLVIAGSTGYIAHHAINAILSSSEPKFDVKILTRADSGKKLPPFPGAEVIPIDYNDHDALVRAVSGADAIISFISGVAAKAVDRLLLKAAQDAGVRRIFPSEYTLDILHPEAVKALTEGGQWPEDTSAVVAAQKFASLANEDGPTSFTTLITSAFMDSWLEGDFGFFDPKNRKAIVVDSGENYFTGCSQPYLAAAIVATLQMDEEKTKNKRIVVTEVRATMNQVLAAYEEVMGVKFETSQITSDELINQRNASLKAGDHSAAAFVAIKLAAFGGSGAADSKAGLDFDADGFLRMKKKTLKEMVADAVAKVRSV
jgi:nucleoside-diphosphate-sugar epimerase